MFQAKPRGGRPTRRGRRLPSGDYAAASRLGRPAARTRPPTPVILRRRIAEAEGRVLCAPSPFREAEAQPHHVMASRSERSERSRRILKILRFAQNDTLPVGADIIRPPDLAPRQRAADSRPYDKTRDGASLRAAPCRAPIGAARHFPQWGKQDLASPAGGGAR
jgi:hypothetical protein